MLIEAGRIANCKRLGRSWLLPAHAEKPYDTRRARQGAPERAFYTLPRKFPLLTMTTMYSVPGSADRMAESLRDDLVAHTLFSAGLAYLRGSVDEAYRLSCELPVDGKRPDVLIAAVFMRCLCALYQGDAQGWLSAKRRLEDLPCLTAEEQAQKSFMLGCIDLSLYDTDNMPDWFRLGSFGALPLDSYPMARYTYMKYTALASRDAGTALLLRPFICECRTEGALAAEIYCLLITAIGSHERGDIPGAAALLDRAIALAAEDRLYAPFAEYYNSYGTLLDERLYIADKAIVKPIRALSDVLSRGWTELNKELRGLVNTVELTNQERHAATLAAKGLTNREIAELMDIKLNTVKRHISSAIGKTGVKGRGELAKYLAMEPMSD